MRAAALAVLAALALAGCSDSACQELGERICSCHPTASRDACETRTEDVVEDRNPDEGLCEALLGRCNPPEGAAFCEWLQTPDGKRECGLAPELPAL